MIGLIICFAYAMLWFVVLMFLAVFGEDIV